MILYPMVMRLACCKLACVWWCNVVLAVTTVTWFPVCWYCWYWCNRLLLQNLYQNLVQNRTKYLTKLESFFWQFFQSARESRMLGTHFEKLGELPIMAAPPNKFACLYADCLMKFGLSEQVFDVFWAGVCNSSLLNTQLCRKCIMTM